MDSIHVCYRFLLKYQRKFNRLLHIHDLNIYFTVFFFGLIEDILLCTKNRWIQIVSNVTNLFLCEAGVCFTIMTLMKPILLEVSAFPEYLIYKSWIAAGILYSLTSSINHLIIIYNLFHKVS